MVSYSGEFHEQRFTIIKNAISKECCELLTEYANFKAKHKPHVKTGDALSGVHREYGDPLMEMFLEKLTPMIEEVTHLQLWPTLSFYYAYKNGDQLNPHKDRSSCQIVAGLCIGADDDFKNNNQPWPLIIENEGKPIPITLDYGDILVFKGHETQHWREAFTGAWFISAIFGYVDKNGPFSFQKYDQRKRLGAPHIGMLRWYYGLIKNHLKSIL